MGSKSKSSLFDDIFQLQSTVPDIDPEDPEDGFKANVTHGATGEVEVLGSTQLKKQTALILDDPKYRGKRTSRKDLYSDDEEEEQDNSRMEEGSSDASDSFADDESENDESDVVGNDGDDDDIGDEDVDEDGDDDAEDESGFDKKKDSVVVPPADGNDREKGKAVSYQLGLWDDLIKCRISLQRMVSFCNRLPAPDVWQRFSAFPSFQKEAASAHSSMTQVLASLLELQEQIGSKIPKQDVKSNNSDGMDEDITSESETEGDKTGTKNGTKDTAAINNDEDDDGVNDSMDDDEENEEDDDGVEKRKVDDMDFDDDDEEEDDEEGDEKENENKDKKASKKRKLSQIEVEKMLSKRHKQFQSFRNNTLAKWDEKTRLTHAKIKSKNFAAFDISVLTQIQQVLSNKQRLIRRIHQNRNMQPILGHLEVDDDNNNEPQELVLEDDEDEVEVRQKRAAKQDVDINYEVVDDTDFYQMCLRDFIQLKQNEETDPVLANRHWLEIQNLRKKHKRKVDTRASKGRKIRYHVKEKLKNFMAPYDKSSWSEEQKDDLFKALFGGRHGRNEDGSNNKETDKAPTINIGL